MNAQELNKILKLHKKWLNGDDYGERADLHDADLSCADLSDADLRWANLSNADLRWANLSNADLRWANLSNADLMSANLCNANLRHANLCNANLRHADLCNADLRHADLCNADLSHAILCNANLSHANLCNAHLSHADLRLANLSHANLYDAILYHANLYDAILYHANLYDAILYHANLSHADLSDAITAWGLACPETGSFEAWKKVVDKNNTEFLVKLLIPADAKRSSATTNKCRCEFADVLEITNIETNQAVQLVENMSYFPTITYRVGERVCPDSYDDNRWNECSHGIHFFVDKESAIHY